jgi:hypothetical protein
VVGVIRLYLELKEDLPRSNRPTVFTPVIDCNPAEAQQLKRRLQRQGYSVIAVPL